MVRQHMHLFHGGDRSLALADQPDPLIEQAQVIGVALQQAMTQGAETPADQPQRKGQPPQLSGWVHPHRHSCQSPGTAGAASWHPGRCCGLTNQ